MLYEGGGITDAIAQYLLSVTAAAIICGITNGLLGKNKTLTPISKLLTGLFLSLTIIRPLVHVDIAGILPSSAQFSADAQRIVSDAEEFAQDQQADIIKTKSEAYILDKAISLGADLKVQITLSDEDPPVPCAIQIIGKVSPYAKTQLGQIIERDLAIPKGAQEWIG